MQYLLDPQSKRGDSPFPEYEFRHYPKDVVHTNSTTVMSTNNTIVGVLLPTACEQIWNSNN